MPFAEIEVEFINDGTVTAPNDALHHPGDHHRRQRHVHLCHAAAPAGGALQRSSKAIHPMVSPEGDEVPGRAGRPDLGEGHRHERLIENEHRTPYGAHSRRHPFGAGAHRRHGVGPWRAGARPQKTRRQDDSENERSSPAAFFAGSLIAIPVGPSSVHLMLGGLIGLMLGTAAFPALFVALALQALLFGMGGLTTLGVNTLNMALPGVVLGRGTRANAAPHKIHRRADADRRAYRRAGRARHRSARGADTVRLLPRTMCRSQAFCSPPICRWRWPKDSSPRRRRIFGPRAAGCAGAGPAMMRRICLALLLALMFASPAAAHKLKVFAAVEGNTVSGYAFFIGGGRAQDTPWSGTRRSRGARLGRAGPAARVNSASPYPSRSPSDITITVDTQEGHIATRTLKAARFGVTEPATEPAGGRNPPHRQSRSPVSKHPPHPTPTRPRASKPPCSDRSRRCSNGSRRWTQGCASPMSSRESS